MTAYVRSVRPAEEPIFNVLVVDPVKDKASLARSSSAGDFTPFVSQTRVLEAIVDRPR